MNTAFKIFRIVNISALILLGLTFISVFLVGLSIGVIEVAVVLALIYAVQVIHPYLCLKLQQRIKMPSLPSSDGLSIQVIITGILNLAYSLYVIYLFLCVTVLSGNVFAEYLLSKKMIGPATVLIAITVVLAAICGLTVAVNSVLSFYFLRKSRKPEQNR